MEMFPCIHSNYAGIFPYLKGWCCERNYEGYRLVEVVVGVKGADRDHTVKQVRKIQMESWQERILATATSPSPSRLVQQLIFAFSTLKMLWLIIFQHYHWKGIDKCTNYNNRSKQGCMKKDLGFYVQTKVWEGWSLCG